MPRHVRLRAPRAEVVSGPLPRPAVHRPDAEQAGVPTVQRLLRTVPNHEGHGDLIQAAPPLALRTHAVFVPRGTARRGRWPATAAGVHDARLPRPRLDRKSVV